MRALCGAALIKVLPVAATAAFVTLGGCGGISVDRSKVVAAPDRADEAVAAVAALYQMQLRPVVYDGTSAICRGGYGRVTAAGDCAIYTTPVVYFYGVETSGWCAGGFIEYGECYDGVTADDGILIIVRIPPEGVTIGGDTDGVPGNAALPHELGHATSVQRGDGPDHDHEGHFFAPGGEVAQATDMLVSLGK
jgi:hypothetical protein